MPATMIANKKNLSILLVDDNQHFRDALKYMVEEVVHENINIYQASSGNEALDIIRKQHIDLVFMDIEMPDMTGIEATRRVTEINRFITVIALSFHQEMQYIMKMLEAGARNYIIKEEINKETIKKVLEVN